MGPIFRRWHCPSSWHCLSMTTVPGMVTDAVGVPCLRLRHHRGSHRNRMWALRWEHSVNQ